MAKKKNPDLKKVVDGSGYPLQMKIEDLAKSPGGRWTRGLNLSEVPWEDKESGLSGFIDLVVGSGKVRLVIECKRFEDSDWIFLIPSDSWGKNRSHTKLAWTYFSRSSGPAVIGWEDFNVEPQSHESSYCAGFEGQRISLERVSFELVLAAEQFAKREISLFSQRHSYDALFVYLPIIITSAKLYICKVDSNYISLKDGKLMQQTFNQVPYIRFRKSLTTRLTDDFSEFDIVAANRNQERTIMIVNSERVSEFFNSWEVNNEHYVSFLQQIKELRKQTII